MNRKQSPAPRQAIALSYDGQAAPTLSAKGDAELAEAILAIARDYEVPIYENAGAGPPARPPGTRRRHSGSAVSHHRRDHRLRLAPERQVSRGFAPDAANGNQMLLLGGPGD